MATIVEQIPVIQEQKQIKQSDLDSLKQRLDRAEQSRLTAQTDYQQMRIKCLQLGQEKELLEHMLMEKAELLKSEMTVWLSSKMILKYYEGQWRERMGLRINHEGLVTGMIYDDI